MPKLGREEKAVSVMEWLSDFLNKVSENPMQIAHGVYNDSRSTFAPGENLRPAFKVKRWKFL